MLSWLFVLGSLFFCFFFFRYISGLLFFFSSHHSRAGHVRPYAPQIPINEERLMANSESIPVYGNDKVKSSEREYTLSDGGATGDEMRILYDEKAVKSHCNGAAERIESKELVSSSHVADPMLQVYPDDRGVSTSSGDESSD
jgi:hypothetical protein